MSELVLHPVIGMKGYQINGCTCSLHCIDPVTVCPHYLVPPLPAFMAGRHLYRHLACVLYSSDRERRRISSLGRDTLNSLRDTGTAGRIFL